MDDCVVNACERLKSLNPEERVHLLCEMREWTYNDKETCLLLEGDVTVTPDGGEPLRFGAGDLVVFPTGMD